VGSNNDSQDMPVLWKFLTIITHPAAFVQPNKPAIKSKRLWLTIHQSLLPCEHLGIWRNHVFRYLSKQIIAFGASWGVTNVFSTEKPFGLSPSATLRTGLRTKPGF